MTLSKKSIIIVSAALLLGIAFIIGLLLLVRSEPRSRTAVYEEKAKDLAGRACLEVIAKTQSAMDAYTIGESYFGGERGYDLLCARAAYARGIAIDPRAVTLAWHQAGRVDFMEGEFTEAITKFEKQFEYFGDSHPSVHYMLGLTYGYKARKTGERADWARAEQSFERYIELDPAGPWARVDLTWILFAQGRYGEMKPLIEEGLLLHPYNPWLLNMYGLALLNTDDREGAQLYFSAALDFAKELSVEDWGSSYPGNDPKSWEVGLSEMITSIEKNLELASKNA